MVRRSVTKKKKIPTASELSRLKKELKRVTEQLESRERELAEASEQQTATAEILRMIADTGANLQSVMDTIAENAAKLCDAADAVVWRVDGDIRRVAAHFGSLPMQQFQEEGDELGRSTTVGRAMLDRQTIHVHDLQAAEAEFPLSKTRGIASGMRTVLVSPLVKDGSAIGAIHIRRREVQPFSDRQIKLLETFADQAVIAIENVRLFEEIQQRNAELHEALEHQTATAEVLSIISRSPTDVQPVLDAIVESAAKVCGIDDVVLRLREGNTLVKQAHFGPIPVRSDEISMDAPQNHWMSEHGTLHIRDGREQNDFPMLGFPAPARTYLLVPLRQQRELIGTLTSRRIEVHPFTPVQIKLLETFADQALIAIENVRLFQELKESLEQQTATSEILGVIASSPTDIQPVLDAVAETAARLCDARDVLIDHVDGDVLEHVAVYGPMPIAGSGRALTRATPAGRAVIDRETIHIQDVVPLLDTEFPEAKARQQATGTRAVVVAPLLREGVAIGAIQLRRPEVRPFSDKQITLLKTFADQAVIAIENVRLFKELQQRNRDLTEALDQQTATGEVLRVIASSPTELQPVLDTLLANAVKLSGATIGHIRQVDGDYYRVVAHYGESVERVNVLRANPLPANPDIPMGRALGARKPVHVLDVQLEPEPVASLVRQTGARTLLVAPLLREGTPIGGITIWRDFVEPFTERQIELVKTFADQAVIAIENVRLFQELKEALEQQTATSEILGVIASSPTDIQPVLNAVAENAARLCEANDSLILRIDGEILKRVAHYGPVPTELGLGPRIMREAIPGRAVVDRKTIHIHDLTAESEIDLPAKSSRRVGVRTALATPLLREGSPIGAIMIRRTEVRSFTERQIKLLETFAAQAVIAIENVRLFKEIQERNAELREALEHQTATAEVLGIISRSPTDVQPVLDAIVESAARVCGIDDVVLRLHEEDSMVPRAHFGPIPTGRVEISIDRPEYRWMYEHGTLHIPDVLEQDDFPMLGSSGRWRTFLAAPLRQQGELVGLLNARRIEVRPFTPAQIKLLETFADQAVIAIENVRLFQELKEALEQQTATSEILGVIASSPTEIQPVLDAVAESAARLCEADDAVIRRLDGNVMPLVAHYGQIPPGGMDAPTVSRGTVMGRAIIERQAIHVRDLAAQMANEFPDSKFYQERSGTRTFLSMPMLREGTPIGVINIRRQEVRPFSEKHIALLKTFADQAVIAIENVRLFKELQERNAELREALEHQTATSEVLGIISRSPTDVQPVLDAIVESAAKVCGIDDVLLRLHEGKKAVPRAHFGPIPIGRMEPSIDEPRFHWMREHGTLHVSDVHDRNELPNWAVPAAGAPSWLSPFASKENSLDR